MSCGGQSPSSSTSSSSTTTSSNSSSATTETQNESTPSENNQEEAEESPPEPPPPEPSPPPPSPPSPPPEENWGTTYYIRTDGGSVTQCDGLVDAAYPGVGNNQPCAWNHPFVALPPDGAPRITGGDRILIANGSYRMGHGAPGANSCASAFPWDCYMPTIPSGADASHPTRIYGEEWDNGCANVPELFGVERAARVLNLQGSNNVHLDCLTITDHLGCVEFHSGNIACPRNNFPYGDWAPVGLYASDSQNVTLKNLNIHGMAARGILAGRLINWLLENVRIAGNGWAGWDGDISGGDSNSGTMTFRQVTVEWNGCGETYSGEAPTGCWGQSAGGYGDGLGTGDTGGNWIFEDSKFLHNTSDGLDLLYHRGAGTITIDRVRAEGNAGNQLKTSGNAVVRNSVVVGNCSYFSGKNFTFNVDHCRALGNSMAYRLEEGSQIQLVNNSVYGQGDCLIEVSDGGCNGTEVFVSRNNIFYGATEFLSPEDRSCLSYLECGALTVDNSHAVIFGVKNNFCPANQNNICANPNFSGPLSGDVYGLDLATDSPAIDSGVSQDPFTPDVDFSGSVRPSGAQIDRGAYEYNAN